MYMDNIISKVYDTQILVSRYNNRQLTVYSNKVELKHNYNSYGMILPFPNKSNKEPIVLDTVLDDINIFKSIDNCFTNNKQSIISNILKYLSDIKITNNNNQRINKEKKDNKYLPIIYRKNYKFSVAHNIKELEKINPNELKFILNIDDIKKIQNNDWKKDEFGFIVLWIDNTKQSPPFAFITNIENNNFFIPTKIFHLSNIYPFYHDKTIQQNEENNINKFSNKLKQLTYKFSNINEKVKIIPYYQLSKILSINTKETNQTNCETFTDTNDSTNNSITNDSTNNSITNDSINYFDIDTNFINFDYKIYILHTCDNKKNNACYNFNPYMVNCSFNKYLKYCPSNKMSKFEINGYHKNKNLWFNVDKNTDNIFIS